MDFILPFSISPLKKKIGYGDKIMLIGSCFSTEIGNKLKDLKFDVFQNPSGIIYHPLVIADILQRTVQNKRFASDEIFKQEGIYHSWYHHSSFSGDNREAVLEKANQNLESANQFLKQAKLLILTPASAFGYYLKGTGKIVANCHKVPANRFEKRLVKSEEIAQSLINVLREMKRMNSAIEIVFTVSPVRHIRDGLVENNRSKAEVISAVGAIIEKAKSRYFPAFEIVNDVLRDYRFFKEDMAHPSDQATDYVFENFIEFAIDKDSVTLMKTVKSIQNALHHKSRFPKSEVHLSFVRKQVEEIRDLINQNPFLNFDSELEFCESFLKK